MAWAVEFHPELAEEFTTFPAAVQDEFLAHARLLEEFGPVLGRPAVDTLKGSKLPNLKELRFGAAGGVWRVAFAFDAKRVAVLLVAGDKKGKGQDRFYKWLVTAAESRFLSWL